MAYTLDEDFHDILADIRQKGVWRVNRTGIRSKELFFAHIEHDMREGFPLLLTRYVPYKSEFTELEGFIKGITDKSWYSERKCLFWEPYTAPGAEDENELGPIYGAQWRGFAKPGDEHTQGSIDQLRILVDKVRQGIDDRRLIVNAWNPLALHQMALPPCHYSFTVHLSPCGSFMDLCWKQRSCDFPIGNALPKYGLLLSLLAREANVTPRKLHGVYENVHIYENQQDAVTLQLYLSDMVRAGQVTYMKKPTLEFAEGDWDIFSFEAAKHVKIKDYNPVTKSIKYPPMAV